MTGIASKLALHFLAILFTFPLGCGAKEPTGDTSPKAASTGPIASAPSGTGSAAAQEPARSGARDKLQGTWEIVRYESEKRIPDEAMPIMGAMFNALRLEFKGTAVIARFAETRVEERASFDTIQESGDEFTLVARGFMFDRARCRFMADGQVEVRDTGDKWAGVSMLRRIP